jgi:hypothetical protein
VDVRKIFGLKRLWRMRKQGTRKKKKPNHHGPQKNLLANGRLTGAYKRLAPIPLNY